MENEFGYWVLIMMGLYLGILCGVLIWCTQHLAQAIAQNGVARDEAQCLIRTAMQKVRAFEDRFVAVTEEARKAVLLSRYWARVASGGWVSHGYLDEATGD